MTLKYQLGDVITQTARGVGHSYTLVRTFDHTNRWGKPAIVLVWDGRCQTCGLPFEATSSRAPRYLNRNCPAHV